MIICVVGEKDSGKTEVACRLVWLLRERGYSVAALKHSASEADLEPSTKDSARLFSSGASPTVFLSNSCCLLRLPPPKVDDVLNALSVVADFVVVEGLKESDYPKIVVGQGEYSNTLLRVDGVCKELEDLARKLEPQRRQGAAFTDKTSVHLNPFIRGLLSSILKAFFGQLRGVEGDSVVVLTRLRSEEGQNDTE